MDSVDYMNRSSISSVFAGLSIAGMLLAPGTASALPPLPGDDPKNPFD
jgi:hypothetical protein